MQFYESCPMLVPGRKGARSAGCWDPENLVKLEEWGDRGFLVIPVGGCESVCFPLRIWYIYGIFTSIYLEKSTKCRWIYMESNGFEMMLGFLFLSNCSTCWVINVFGWAWNCQLVANCQRISMKLSMNITNPPPCIFVSMQLLCTHHLVVVLH